jgi:hypothetical protein
MLIQNTNIKIFERKKRGWKGGRFLEDYVLSRTLISHQLTIPRTASAVVSAAATTVLRTRLA